MPRPIWDYQPPELNELTKRLNAEDRADLGLSEANRIENERINRRLDEAIESATGRRSSSAGLGLPLGHPDRKDQAQRRRELTKDRVRRMRERRRTTQEPM
jgi:hypothetical protein